MSSDLLKRASTFTGEVINRFYPAPGEKIGDTFTLPKLRHIPLAPGELSVWSGLNGHGKSLLLNQFALDVAKEGQQVAIASFEMSAKRTLYDRNASPYGYGPLQESEVALALNKSAGYLGNGASRTAQRFARATGTDMTVGVGFMGDVYRMTGANADKQGRLMDVLVSLKENSKDKRTEEILKTINTNLVTLFRAQGGKELTDAQIASVMSTTMGIYNKGGTMGNSPEMFNTMQGALRLFKETSSFLDKGGADFIGNIRGNRMDPVFEAMGKKYGLKPSLLKAIAEAESQFNYKARSPKGAQGIMQLMPQTAKDMGVKDPFNPVQSIEGGAKYLRSLLDRYNGDTDKALAAYNWGPGNVDRSGVTSLPAETRTYLGKVKGAQLRYGSTEANLDPTAASGGPGMSDTSFLGWAGLFKRAVECLEQLVTNTTPGMPQQTPLSGPLK